MANITLAVLSIISCFVASNTDALSNFSALACSKIDTKNEKLLYRNNFLNGPESSKAEQLFQFLNMQESAVQKRALN